MRHIYLSLFLFVLLLTVIILHSLEPAQAETTTGVIVDGADSTWRANITAQTALNANIQTIQPSLVAQYANATFYYKLRTVPTALQTQLDGLVQSMIIEFVDAVAYEPLVVIPATLQSALLTMLPAVETQFVNSSAYTMLHYPVALIADTDPPTISNVNAPSTSSGTVLTWNTNEFARCIVNYGSQPGNYTETISATLYFQAHELILPNATQGATYFVQFICTDQSGNVSTSPEFTVTIVVEQRVWLPLIKK